MLDMYTKAAGSEHYSNVVAGAWKFHDKAKFRFGVTSEELIETAKLLINEKVGPGRYVHLFVRPTGRDELGICFMYELTDDEVRRRHTEDLREPYKDFFARRHGGAFKGWDIGGDVDIITLTN